MPEAHPIRILHLISTLDTGGAERNLAHLVIRMDRSLFENQVVSMTADGPIGEKIRAQGVPVDILDLRKGLPDPRGIKRLGKIVRAFKPNIIQTWMYHANLLGCFFSKRTPLIWNLRCSDMDLNHYGPIYRLVVRLGAWCARIPDAVIANSYAGESSHTGIGYHPRRWKIIPNGFDTALFRPDPTARVQVRQELNIPHNAIVIGLIARLDPIKDHPTFFSAARILLEKHPDVHFVLAGRGVEVSNPSIQPRLKDMSGNLHLLGEQREVHRIMASLDIATSSSSSEGLPNTIGEAMATGLPCVVTNVGDSGLLVDKTGVVVPPRNPEALAQAWTGLIDAGPEYRTNLGHLARERIQTQYGMAAMVGRYENLYRGIKKDYEADLRGSLCRR